MTAPSGDEVDGVDPAGMCREELRHPVPVEAEPDLASCIDAAKRANGSIAELARLRIGLVEDRLPFADDLARFKGIGGDHDPRPRSSGLMKRSTPAPSGTGFDCGGDLRTGLDRPRRRAVDRVVVDRREERLERYGWRRRQARRWCLRWTDPIDRSSCPTMSRVVPATIMTIAKTAARRIGGVAPRNPPWRPCPASLGRPVDLSQCVIEHPIGKAIGSFEDPCLRDAVEIVGDRIPVSQSSRARSGRPPQAPRADRPSRSEAGTSPFPAGCRVARRPRPASGPGSGGRRRRLVARVGDDRTRAPADRDVRR